MNTIKNYSTIDQSFGRHLPTCSRRKVIKARSLLIFLIIFICGFSATTIRAQDPEPTPAPQETPQATPAPLPSPKATPLAGTVEGTDTMHIESKIQAYRSMSEITRNIADDIHTFAPGAKTFVLYRADDYKTWQNYRLNKTRLEQQMKTLKCNYLVWLSLVQTASQPLETGKLERILFSDIPNGNECQRYRDIASLAPEVEAIRKPRKKEKFVVVDADKFLSDALGDTVKDNNKNNNAAANVASALGTAIGFISPVTAAVGTAIDLLSYFRSDLKFTGTTVTIKDNAARANMADSLQIRYCGSVIKQYPSASKYVNEKENENKLRRYVSSKSANCPAVYDPHLFTPDLVLDNGKPSNGLMADGRTLPEGVKWMSELVELREKSRVTILAYEFLAAKAKNYDTRIAAISAAIAADDALIKDYTGMLITLEEKSKNAKSDLRKQAFKEIKELMEKAKAARAKKVAKLQEVVNESESVEIPENLDFVIDNLKAMNTSFDAFAGAFTKISDTTGLSPQMIYERAARLDALFTNETKPAYWLDVNALEMEGNTRVRKNLFRYFYYPDISHNGGSIVQYALSDASGRVLLSNTEDDLRKYRKSSNIIKRK